MSSLRVNFKNSGALRSDSAMLLEVIPWVGAYTDLAVIRIRSVDPAIELTFCRNSSL
jgi:hypothetical protein